MTGQLLWRLSIIQFGIFQRILIGVEMSSLQAEFRFRSSEEESGT
jgi:hypothetical protein